MLRILSSIAIDVYNGFLAKNITFINQVRILSFIAINV